MKRSVMDPAILYVVTVGRKYAKRAYQKLRIEHVKGKLSEYIGGMRGTDAGPPHKVYNLEYGSLGVMVEYAPDSSDFRFKTSVTWPWPGGYCRQEHLAPSEANGRMPTDLG